VADVAKKVKEGQKEVKKRKLAGACYPSRETRHTARPAAQANLGFASKKVVAAKKK